MKCRFIIHVGVDLTGSTLLQLFILVLCVNQAVYSWYSLQHMYLKGN